LGDILAIEVKSLGWKTSNFFFFLNPRTAFPTNMVLENLFSYNYDAGCKPRYIYRLFEQFSPFQLIRQLSPSP